MGIRCRESIRSVCSISVNDFGFHGTICDRSPCQTEAVTTTEVPVVTTLLYGL